MRFRVHHLTQYRYAVPVALGPHLLRLTPRAGGTVAQEIRVSPEPAFRQDETDAFGNRVTRLGFTSTTRELTIDSLVSLDTRGTHPPRGGVLDAYLARRAADPAVEAAAARLRELAGPDPQAFTDSLTATLYATIAHDTGEVAKPKTPREVLASAAGTSSDIAGLFVELCRRAGLPARFVAGYRADSPQDTTPRALHVWPEVLLPGTGWQGYDPTRGRQVAEAHVALACAPDPAGTLPVVGSYFGADTDMTLEVALNIQTAG